MAYSNQAQLDMLADRTEPPLRWAGRALELGRRLDDQETLTHTLTNIGSVHLHQVTSAGEPSWNRRSRWRSRPGSRTTPPGR